jgi:hypothetical protein
MLRNELLSISVTRDEGVFGLHVVALDDRGVPRHAEYSAKNKHGIGILLARTLKRWMANIWTA